MILLLASSRSNSLINAWSRCGRLIIDIHMKCTTRRCWSCWKGVRGRGESRLKTSMNLEWHYWDTEPCFFVKNLHICLVAVRPHLEKKVWNSLLSNLLLAIKPIFFYCSLADVIMAELPLSLPKLFLFSWAPSPPKLTDCSRTDFYKFFCCLP